MTSKYSLSMNLEIIGDELGGIGIDKKDVIISMPERDWLLLAHKMEAPADEPTTKPREFMHKGFRIRSLG